MRETQQNADAEEELVRAHMPLVGHLVRQTMGRVPSHVDRDDLTAAGLMALVKSARSYDKDRGVPFASYAKTRINGAILDELRGVDWASRAVRRTARDVDATRTQLAGMLGRSATTAEVASALGLTQDEVAGNDEDIARAQVLSLQAAESGLDAIIASSAPSPEQLLEHKEQLDYLIEAVAELPTRLRQVVQDYFFEEHPMAEIAAELGVTESRISQMRAEAMVLLRDAMNHGLAPELLAPEARPDGCAARRRTAYFNAVAARHSASLRRPQQGLLDETG